MSVFRRFGIAAVLAACSLAAAPAIAQDTWPNRTITFVSGFPGGAATDLYSRKLGSELAKQFNVPVITDNRTGAGGNIASGIVAAARPDGYTFLLGTAGTHAINASLYKSLNFDVVQDFTPVALLGDLPNVLLVNPDKHPDIKTCKDLIALAKQKPGALNYASTGNGASGHLAGVQFTVASKIDAMHVPYRGQGPAMTALLAGEVDFFFNQSAPSIPHVRAGRARALAITSAAPVAALSEVPTVAEACDLPGFTSTTWYAIFGPKDLPAPIQKAMSDAIVTTTRTPAFREWLHAQAIAPIEKAGPEDLKALQQADIERWAAVVKASGAKVD